MSEKNTLNYQKSLTNFITLFKFIYPFLAVATVFIVFRYKVQYYAFALGMAAAVIFALLAALCWINMNNRIEYDHESMEVIKLFGKKTINFADLTAIKDTGRHIDFYEGSKRVLKLSGITHDVNDIANLINAASSHKVQLEDAEKHTIWDTIYGHDKMTMILLVLSILNFVYMMTTIIISTTNLVPFFIISLIIPLFSLGYYIYSLMKGNVDILSDARVLFFMTLIIPAFTLIIAIAKAYTISSFTSVFVITIILFILIDILYRRLSTLLGVAADNMLKVYIFMIIAVLLVSLNLMLPSVETKTSTSTVTEITVQSSKVMFGYIVKTEDADGNTNHFNVPSSKITQYKVNEQVTITENVGPFGVIYSTAKPN
ncbi:MAG: hypothetical protein J6P61_01940 [Erysipelotrichaceae bacterium]|nr:hypothetical protein [Erysipelotrichaceae bacterium]